MKSTLKKATALLVAFIMTAIIISPTCLAAKSTAVKLNVSKKTLHYGKTYNLKVLNSTKKLSWTSSNKKVVTVSNNGKITAKSAGAAVVKVKTGKKTLSAKITVPKYTKKVIKKATCMKTGSVKISCKHCSKTYNLSLPVDKDAHTYVKKITKPTCTKKGYTTYTCKHNKVHMYRTDYVNTIPHKLDDGTIIKKPTFETEGEKKYTCLVCDSEKIVKLDKLTADFQLKTDKKSYEFGEDIIVSAKGLKNSWVGIYFDTDNADLSDPIYKYDLSNKNNETENFNMKADSVLSGSRQTDSSLPLGNYKILLYKNDTVVADYQKIEICAPSSPVLFTDKLVYKAGEPIYVTASGSGDDWVGIYSENDSIGPSSEGNVESIYWYYAAKEGHVSCGTYEIKKQYHNTQRAEFAELPEGNYKVLLLADGGYDIIKQIDIKVTGTLAPDKPIDFNYEIENPDSGMANGTVTVTLDSKSLANAKDIVMYWADENGKLTNYSALAKFKVTGTVTKHDMPVNTIIPEGATRLLCYTSNNYSESKEFLEYKLPEGCNFVIDDKDLLTEFQVISDIHVNQNGGSQDGNKHLPIALRDIASLSPNSSGVFVVGDIADTGHENEYQKVQEIIDSTEGLAPVYYAVGNHDLSQGYDIGSQLFMKYAKTDKMYYEKEINGFSYIFLGSETAGLHANLSDNQLEWLNATLTLKRLQNPLKPVFVFLHQSLANTVAGSFNGQGWDGVEISTGCAEKLRAILKKNPQVIMFNGHSHWEFNSTGNMFLRNSDLPTIFNTSSVAYLWTSYDKVTGEYLSGSQGYFVRVYKDKILVLGRNFDEGKYAPSAMYVINTLK